MLKFRPNFCCCAVDQEKAVFKRKRAVSGPSALSGPEMVKFGPNFCYYAVYQEKAVFKRKRPSTPLGPEMIKFSPNFCCCAVYQEKVVFKRKRAVSSPSALFGPIGFGSASWTCPVQTRRMPVWVWGWLEAFRFFRWCLNWMLPILNNWIGVCKLDLSSPDQTDASLGLGVARGFSFL